MTDAAAPFEPPGPGQWKLDRSHFPGATTPIGQWLMEQGLASGTASAFRDNGVPAKTIAARFVHGYMYSRIIPLTGGDKPPRSLPPDIVLKVATRLHPTFRSRRRIAKRGLRDRPYLAKVREWESSLRPGLVASNQAFASADLEAMSDSELEGHLNRLFIHVQTNTELHFVLHGHDLGPVARYLYNCIQWGLDPAEASSALAGASPSTSAPLERLARLREIVEKSGRSVTSLDDVRAVSTEAADLLDEHLREYGSTLVTGYDLTAFTLGELPGVLLSSILSAQEPVDTDVDDIVSALRADVPAALRAEFDDSLADARFVMDMRDDNGPKTIETPWGLLRLALLEVGRRLCATGALAEADHVLELTQDEARSALSKPFPSAAAIQQRAQERLAHLTVDPPLTLGPDEPQPPLDVLPEPLGDMVAMVQTAVEHLGMDGSASADPFVGVGIGTSPYRGKVCVADSADAAIERLEPGDVLVVRATSPAFNAVLTVAGAIVTANGGALSHAAVLARELGIPAVVGVAGALDLVDGSSVDVDPVAGRVTPVV